MATRGVSADEIARIAVVGVNTDHAHLESTLATVAGEAATARDILLVDQQMEFL